MRSTIFEHLKLAFERVAAGTQWCAPRGASHSASASTLSIRGIGSITCFAYEQYGAEPPPAVLGMLDVEGRDVMCKQSRDETSTVIVPMPVSMRLGKEAGDSVLRAPGWTELRSNGPGRTPCH